MYKFILIFALFVPQTGEFKITMGPFKDLVSCSTALEAVRKEITPNVGVNYFLSCESTKPTDGIEI